MDTILDIDKVGKVIDGFCDVISVYRAEDEVNLLEVLQAVRSVEAVIFAVLKEQIGELADSLAEPPDGFSGDSESEPYRSGTA